MELVLTTDYSTTSLVSLADAKQHLRIGSNYDNANVTTMLDAARGLVELDSNRAILNQTFTLKLNYFPDVIYLPMGRIQSVTSVTYLDINGNTQTLVDGTNYFTTTGFDDGTIVPDNDWPTDINTEQKNVVTVVYVAGYGAAKSQDTRWAETATMLKLGMLYYNMTESKAYDSIINKNRHHSSAWYKNADRRSIQLR